jgi:hypothetical protein
MTDDSVETFPPFVPEWYHLSSAQEPTCLDFVTGILCNDRVPVFLIHVNPDGTSLRGTCVHQIDLAGVPGSYYLSYACEPLMCQEPKVLEAMLAEGIDCYNGKVTLFWILRNVLRYFLFSFYYRYRSSAHVLPHRGRDR